MKPRHRFECICGHEPAAHTGALVELFSADRPACGECRCPWLETPREYVNYRLEPLDGIDADERYRNLDEIIEHRNSTIDGMIGELEKRG